MKSTIENDEINSNILNSKSNTKTLFNSDMSSKKNQNKKLNTTKHSSSHCNKMVKTKTTLSSKKTIVLNYHHPY